MKGVLLSVLAGALLTLVSGCTSSPLATSSRAGAVHLQGALVTHQTVGQETTLHLHLCSDIGWPEAPLLDLEGIQHWRIHIPMDSNGDPEGVGTCAGSGDEVPIVIQEEMRSKSYVQLPGYVNFEILFEQIPEAFAVEVLWI